MSMLGCLLWVLLCVFLLLAVFGGLGLGGIVVVGFNAAIVMIVVGAVGTIAILYHKGHRK